MAEEQQVIHVVFSGERHKNCIDIDEVIGVTAHKHRADALVAKKMSSRVSPNDRIWIKDYVLDDPKVFPEAIEDKGGQD